MFCDVLVIVHWPVDSPSTIASCWCIQASHTKVQISVFGLWSLHPTRYGGQRKERGLVLLAESREHRHVHPTIRPRRCTRKQPAPLTLVSGTSTALWVFIHLHIHLHHSLTFVCDIYTFAIICIIAYHKSNQHGAARRNAHRYGEPLHSHHQSCTSASTPLIAEAMHDV